MPDACAIIAPHCDGDFNSSNTTPGLPCMPTSSGEPAERSVSIFLRSSADSQLTFSGRSNQMRLQASQIKPKPPRMIKAARQPQALAIAAVTTAPSAGPRKLPALQKALATPRSCAGIHSRTMRPQDGIEVASPAPITMRATIRVAKLHTPAVAAIASDHSAMPMELMFRAEKRSSRMPIGKEANHIGP